MHSLADDVETIVGQDPDDLERPVTIDHAALNGGIYVTGDDPHQQTTLLQDWCVQWAEAGLGFCYVHPRGPDPRELLARLPEHRLEDVVWIDFRRSALTDHLDVPDSERVAVAPFEGPEESVDHSALLTDPVTARTTDFVAACSVHHQFDWNVARILTTVLPWLYEESGPEYNELSPALRLAGLDETTEPVLELAPMNDDPTARAHLDQAVAMDPGAFTIASQCLGWPRDPFPSNPLVGGTTYPLHRALTDQRIVLVTGALPSADVPPSQSDADRLGTHLLVATVVQRLWEAAQTHTLAEPFPLLLDGVVDLVPEPGVRFRELLEHGADTPLGVVASGPASAELSETTQRIVSEHADTRLVRVTGAAPEGGRSLRGGENAVAERYLEREETSAIAEGPLWWVQTGMGGTVASDPQSKVQSRPAVPRDPPTAKRDPDAVAEAIRRSVERHGTDPAWLTPN